MALTPQQIKSEWQTIRTESVSGANSAERVGKAGVDIADYLIENTGNGGDTQFIAENLIGVIRGYISSNNVTGKKSRIAWLGDSGYWVWVIEGLTSIMLPIGTKVFNLETNSTIIGLQANKVYILKASGQVELDEGGGTPPIFNSTAFLQSLMNNAIGTIRVTEINPQLAPSPTTFSFVSFLGAIIGWKWTVPNTVTGEDTFVQVPVGTKVMMNGVYYTLHGDGTYTEDAPFDKVNFLKTFIGVKRVININPSSLSLSPYVEWVTGDLKSHWNYHVDANNVFPIANDTIVQHETSAGVVTYQRLKDDGTTTQVIF